MPTRAQWRRAARIALKILIGIIAIPIAWFAFALILGAIPANVAWRAPAQGITIFVRSNGVHTWIVMPKTNRYMDWTPYSPGEHLRDPRWGNGNYVAIGYGNRDVYLNTPTWGDLSARSALAAAVGIGPSLMHVEHDHNPRPDRWQRPIKLTPAQYVRLTRYVRSRFRHDGQGRTIPILGRGYGANDMFYEADGGYSAILTCNEWTGRALRAAGVRTGLWTPLEQSIMWRLD